MSVTVNQMSEAAIYHKKVYDLAEQNDILITFNNEGFIIREKDFSKYFSYGDMNSEFSTFKGIYLFFVKFLRARKLKKIRKSLG